MSLDDEQVWWFRFHRGKDLPCDSETNFLGRKWLGRTGEEDPKAMLFASGPSTFTIDGVQIALSCIDASFEK